MPYDPGVVDRSGEIMAQGISSGVSSIADTINQFSQRAKQAKAYRMMAVDGLGMDPDKVDQMSLEDLQGHMQGVAMKSAQAQAQAKAADIRSQMMEREAVAKAREADTSAAANYNRLMAGATAPDAGLSAVDAMNQGLVNGNPMVDVGGAIARPTVGQAMTPTLQQRLMAQAGLSPRQQFDVARAGKAMAPAGDNGAPPIFTEDPVTGFRFANKGKVLSPSGVNPDKAKTPEAIELHDEEGNPSGITALWDGKRWITKAKPKTATGELLPVLDPVSKQPVEGMGMDATGKVHDFRTQIQKMVTPTRGAAPAKVDYKSADEVRAAMLAGTLKRDEASKILKDQFGFK